MTELGRVDEDLDALENRLAVMSSFAEEQVRSAVDALLSGDRPQTRISRHRERIGDYATNAQAENGAGFSRPRIRGADAAPGC